MDLLPGDYLVEVVWDDGRFHEVYRRVPEKVEVVPAHGRQSFWFSREFGSIELIEVLAPPIDVTSEMVFINGGALHDGKNAMNSEGEINVPGFYIDGTEVTVKSYKQIKRGTLPYDRRYIQKPDNYPITIPYDDAVSLAELLGKRLPDESEFELAAMPHSQALARQNHQEKSPIILQDVNDESLDRLDTYPQVIGLLSNAIEWTNSQTDLSALHAKPNILEEESTDVKTIFQRHWNLRVARGVPRPTTQLDGFRNNVDPGLPDRVCIQRFTLDNRIGFRCVRSIRPRLTPEDFVKTALD